MEQNPHLAKSAGEHLATEPPQPTRVPVKVYRSDSRLMVALLMPGLQPEDIRVAIHADGRLIVEGRMRGVLKGVKEARLTTETVPSSSLATYARLPSCRCIQISSAP